MKLLLDTHAILWWLGRDAQLSKHARGAIEDAGTEAAVSVVSIWEASIKTATGRLRGPELRPWVEKAGLPFLHIDERHAQLAGALPLHHRDPFDRMLVAQAMREGLTLVTADRHIAKYDVKVIW